MSISTLKVTVCLHLSNGSKWRSAQRACLAEPDAPTHPSRGLSRTLLDVPAS